MDEVDGELVEPEWSMPGLDKGMYCITPRPEYWHLDKHSRQKKRTRRHQLPLVPGFARTAYSTQGYTLPAGKVDLNLHDHADPVTGYVAMSRFKRADDVLIIQPFDLAVFQQGIADQPRLLLERLRDMKKDINILR